MDHLISHALGLPTHPPTVQLRLPHEKGHSTQQTSTIPPHQPNHVNLIHQLLQILPFLFHAVPHYEVSSSVCAGSNTHHLPSSTFSLPPSLYPTTTPPTTLWTLKLADAWLSSPQLTRASGGTHCSSCTCTDMWCTWLAGPR